MIPRFLSFSVDFYHSLQILKMIETSPNKQLLECLEIREGEAFVVVFYLKQTNLARIMRKMPKLFMSLSKTDED